MLKSIIEQEVRRVWISKKKFKELEKKVADLEVQVQSQQEFIEFHINCHEEENIILRNLIVEDTANSN